MEILNDNTNVIGDTKYAGFGRRFIALIIDNLIISGIGVLPFYLFFGEPQKDPSMEFPLFVFSSELIKCLYFALMESSAKQATIGKIALYIKVTDINGKRLTLMNAIGRYLAKYISAIILGIGYLMAAFTDKKQALHDKLAGTVVVKE